MNYSYRVRGVCSVKVDFELSDDHTLHHVHFTGGCAGNLSAIAKLVEGRDAREVADLLDGNRCGFKDTSCADQFAKAIRGALAESQH